LLLLFALLPDYGSTQEPSAPYLIPQTVFVGDKARLVIPLDAVFSAVEPVVLAKREELPSSPELVIHRIELERRSLPSTGGSARLLIDFTAFAVGTLFLPELKIPSGDSVLLFSNGVTIPIASILSGDVLALAPSAPPLTVPGTVLLVYGTAGSIFLLLLLGIGLRFWGRDRASQWLTGFRRKRQIIAMEKLLINLRKDLAEPTPEGLKEAEALTVLSAEFRTFLTVFTGVYCQALSAGEFAGLSPAVGREAEPLYGSVLSGAFLCGIFRRCDALRFSGTRLPHQELLDILNEIQRFVDALKQTEGPAV
jgi:hypothetical protein